MRAADVKDHELPARAAELEGLVAALAEHSELAKDHEAACAALADVRKREAAHERLGAAVQDASALPGGQAGARACSVPCHPGVKICRNSMRLSGCSWSESVAGLDT